MAIPFESNLASIAVSKLAQRTTPRSVSPAGSSNVALTIVDDLPSKPSARLVQPSHTTLDSSLSLFNKNLLSSDVMQLLENEDFPYAGKDSLLAKPELLTELPISNQTATDLRLPFVVETTESPPLLVNDGSIRNAEANAEALTSYLMQDGVGITANSSPVPNVVQPYGKLSLTCITYRATPTTPEYFLLDSQKLSPGWFSNVNWSDNDIDGWNPASTKTTTADPAATYTPDRDDPYVAGGEPDLRKFVINLTDTRNTPNANYSVRLFWDSSVRIYENQDKSGRIEPGGLTTHIFTTADMNPHIDPDGLDVNYGSKVLWLEGYNASTTFGDLELMVDYVGGNIPLIAPSDTVKVTVFGATQKGFYSGKQNDDNTVKYSTFNGAPYSGFSNWDDADPNHKVANGLGNQMEAQGTVSPSVASSPKPYPVSFDMTRMRYGVLWYKHLATAPWVQDYLNNQPNRRWVNDDFANGADKMLKPSSANHIYFIDIPRASLHTIPPSPGYYQQHLNFANWVTVTIYNEKFQISDFLRWESQLYTKPNAAGTARVRDTMKPQTLADGWIDLPGNAL